MRHARIAVHRWLGECAEAYLVLPARAFPCQFYHALIEKVVERERRAWRGVDTVAYLVDERESSSLVAKAVLSLSL